MNSILDHKWGESRAVDYAWSQVSGMSPSKAGKTIIMVWQAFIDESESKVGDLDFFVLGGCISTAEQWAKFTAEWEPLVDKFGRLDDKGRYFHMTEMPDMEDVAAFYRCIERHVPAYVSARYRRGDFYRAMNRIVINGAPVIWDKNDYFLAFRMLMDMFHGNRKHENLVKVLPDDEIVYFYFDETGNKAVVRRIWDEYLANRSEEVRHLYGAEPRFESDRRYLALQAADFWAWWVRKWCENGTPENIGKHDFGSFTKTKGVYRAVVDIFYNEDQIAMELAKMARSQAPTGSEIAILPSAPQS